MESNVIEITSSNKATMNGVYPKILYFTAKWCGPCQRISPVYADLSKTNPGVTFFKIDVDKSEDLTTTYAIQSMPTFIFFRSGTDFESFSGADVNKLNAYVNWVKS